MRWGKGFLGPPPAQSSSGLVSVSWLFSEVGANSSESSFQGGGNNREEGTFLRRGPKGAQRRAREANRAPKASQNGDKRETKAKRWRGAKPFG